jgi:hypothetical protein
MHPILCHCDMVTVLYSVHSDTILLLTARERGWGDSMSVIRLDRAAPLTFPMPEQQMHENPFISFHHFPNGTTILADHCLVHLTVGYRPSLNPPLTL